MREAEPRLQRHHLGDGVAEFQPGDVDDRLSSLLAERVDAEATHHREPLGERAEGGLVRVDARLHPLGRGDTRDDVGVGRARPRCAPGGVLEDRGKLVAEEVGHVGGGDAGGERIARGEPEAQRECGGDRGPGPGVEPAEGLDVGVGAGEDVGAAVGRVQPVGQTVESRARLDLHDGGGATPGRQGDEIAEHLGRDVPHVAERGLRDVEPRGGGAVGGRQRLEEGEVHAVAHGRSCRGPEGEADVGMATARHLSHPVGQLGLKAQDLVAGRATQRGGRDVARMHQAISRSVRYMSSMMPISLAEAA